MPRQPAGAAAASRRDRPDIPAQARTRSPNRSSRSSPKPTAAPARRDFSSGRAASGATGGTPAASDDTTGIASTIAVNPAVVTSEGGDATKLRDGSISGITDLNTSGNSGFSDNLDALYQALTEQRSFSSDAGLSTSQSLTDYASASIGWLEQYRSDATSASETTAAALSRSDEAYSNETGVNLDEELTLLWTSNNPTKRRRRSNVIDEMFQSFLDMAG